MLKKLKYLQYITWVKNYAQGTMLSSETKSKELKEVDLASRTFPSSWGGRTHTVSRRHSRGGRGGEHQDARDAQVKRSHFEPLARTLQVLGH